MNRLVRAPYNEVMTNPGEINLEALRIIRYPDPRLQRACGPVEDFDERLAGLAERMLSLMYAARGVGLAAPQVGVSLRMFVANPTGEPGADERVYVNPELLNREGTVAAKEGCLSIPNLYCTIKRAARVTIRAADLSGRVTEVPAEGLLARIFQHETDHLEGILLTDRMSAVAKLSNRRLLRELEEEYAATRAAARPGR